MFRVERDEAKQRWIVNLDVEDGSFTESWNTGKAERSLQRYGLMRERFIVGGGSTGRKGGRVYESNLTDPTRSIEPLNLQ
jgi:phosphoenolpyruvate carboxylase